MCFSPCARPFIRQLLCSIFLPFALLRLFVCLLFTVRCSIRLARLHVACLFLLVVLSGSLIPSTCRVVGVLIHERMYIYPRPTHACVVDPFSSSICPRKCLFGSCFDAFIEPKLVLVRVPIGRRPRRCDPATSERASERAATRPRRRPRHHLYHCIACSSPNPLAFVSPRTLVDSFSRFSSLQPAHPPTHPLTRSPSQPSVPSSIDLGRRSHGARRGPAPPADAPGTVLAIPARVPPRPKIGWPPSRRTPRSRRTHT